MPPVAEEQQSPLAAKLQVLLAAKTNGIGSQRELAKRTAAIKRTTVEGERKSIRLHMRGGGVEEQSLVAYAEAFGVSRDEFPAATPRSWRVEELTRRLEEYARQREAELAELPPDLSGALAALQAVVDLQRKTIEALDARLAALERAYIAAQTPPATGPRTTRVPRRKAS